MLLVLHNVIAGVNYFYSDHALRPQYGAHMQQNTICFVFSHMPKNQL